MIVFWPRRPGLVLRVSGSSVSPPSGAAGVCVRMHFICFISREATSDRPASEGGERRVCLIPWMMPRVLDSMSLIRGTPRRASRLAEKLVGVRSLMPAAAGTHECLPCLRVLKPDGTICIVSPPPICVRRDSRCHGRRPRIIRSDCQFGTVVGRQAGGPI